MNDSDCNFDLKAAQNEIKKYNDQYGRDHSIADLTPTICELMGIPCPAQCAATPIPGVIDQAGHIFNGNGKAEKVLLFCADAFGDYQRDNVPGPFERIQKVAGMRIKSVSLMPSVTPVCYGSIFSGTPPLVHGIQKYEKPVLTVETLFDVLAAAGRNVAIISSNNCSIDCIFRRRKVDYFSLRDGEAAFDITQRVLNEMDYDVVVSYMGSYDSKAHRTGLFSAESIAQLELGAERFEKLAATVDKVWAGKNRVLALVPDHGQHHISDTKGGHGENSPEDMLVSHYYRIDS